MKAIAAGLMIGLGAMLNLQLGGVIGAICFSLGLFTICALGLHLFTGKIATILEGNLTLLSWGTIFLGNWLGILFMVICVSMLPQAQIIQENAAKIAIARQQSFWLVNLVRGMICGMCVQMAVDMWKKLHHPLAVIMPIAAFIILGGAHCIADLFYLTLGMDGWQLPQIFEVMVGNVSGAALFEIASWGNLHPDCP